MGGLMSGVTTKVCNKCEIEKSLEDFSPHKEGRYGRYGTCKSCINARNRERREEKARSEGREYFPRPETEDERQERVRLSKYKNFLKSRFNLSWDEYQRMFEEQEGCCAICGRHESEFKFRLGVDHDHRCCPGKKSCGRCIRGLLCQPCNAALGGFQDEPLVMESAISYVMEHRYAVV